MKTETQALKYAYLIFVGKFLMQRIQALLQKLTELSEKGTKISLIELDLMMDYTRVLYADMLDMKKVVEGSSFTQEDKAPVPDKEQVNSPAEPSQVTTAEYKDVPVHDIRTMIGINDKYLFIAELFNDDKSAYDQAVKTFNGFDSYSEALEWSNSTLAIKYNWAEDSDTVQQFYSLLNKCFSSI